MGERGSRATVFLPLAMLMAVVLAPSAGAQITREGVLREAISENLARGESMTTYSLRSDGETTPVLPTSPVSATTGDRVVVEGTMHDGALVGSVAPTEQDVGASESTTAALPGGPIFIGPRRVLVLHAKFAGDPDVPWSPEAMRQKIFTGTESADAYFQEESRGVIALAGKTDPENGDVTDWLTLNSSGSGCSQNTWGNEALARASQEGIPITGYNHLVFVFTKRFGCFWNGMATLGGNSGTIYINGNEDVQTIAHEFGHNFGLHHAGSWTCTRNGARVQISNSCSTQEYGDVFDAMGNRFPRHNNGWNLEKLGMLGPANIATVTEDGSYALRAALSVSPAPTILRIPRTKGAGGNVISWYYLEIRQQGGIFESLFDATMTGVTVRATASGSSPETLLIDGNPDVSGFLDAPLQAGETFTDKTVRVTTLSAGGGAASVSVEFGDWIDEETPTAPANVSASQNAGGVSLQWSASTDNFGVARYVVFRNGSLIGTSPTTSFTDTSPRVGLNAYTVYAEDETGNRSPASAPYVMTVADLAAPSAPANVSALQGSGGVNLHWSASTDNVGVSRYVVVRDGSEIGTSPISVFTDTSVPAGQHTYTVYAEDEAGNRSPGSAPRVVTVIALTSPSDSTDDPPGRKDRASRLKPALRLQRRPNGTIAFEVDARMNRAVARVSLWLDGKLLRSRKGRVLRLVWKPRVASCARVYRLSARAYQPTTGRRVIATARNRNIRLPNPSGRCRRTRG